MQLKKAGDGSLYHPLKKIEEVPEGYERDPHNPKRVILKIVDCSFRIFIPPARCCHGPGSFKCSFANKPVTRLICNQCKGNTGWWENHI